MNHLRKHLSTCLLGITALLGGVSAAGAPPPPPPPQPTQGTAPNLGTAANFAALGGTGVTCTSPNPPLPFITISGGDVGSLSLAPTTVTGFPGFTPGALPCSLSGTVQLGATAAFGSFLAAYTALDLLNSCPRPAAEAGHNLAGLLTSGSQGSVLEPGIYCISGVGTLTSQLTLNGPATAVWIFKAASSLTPIGGSVVMAGGGQASNVYWRLGTAATFDSNSDFVGNVLAGSAITFTGIGSSLCGRALATTNVTLTGANISVSNCGGVQPPPPPPSCDKGHKHHKHHKHDKSHCDGDDDGHGNGHGEDDDDDGHESDHHHPFGSNDDHGRKDGKGGDR